MIYGRATRDEVLLYTAVTGMKELFVRAEKAKGKGSMDEEWLLTHLSIEASTIFASRLAQLPESASADDILATLAATPMQTYELGMLDRRVKVGSRK